VSVNEETGSGSSGAAGADDTERAGSALTDPECQRVLDDVWLFLDDEMDPDRRARVEQHLMDCPPCLDETDVGHRLKSLLHRKCGGDTAPAVLRESLVAALSIQLTVVESSAQTNA
jgi:mycothiol system anti-sigma-R factor